MSSSTTTRNVATPVLERLFQDGATATRSDPELLAMLRRADDPSTRRHVVEVFVARYLGLVEAACRRHLRGGPDLDDAVQATFLVLIRKIDGLRVRHALGPWLYGVALRVSRRASERRREVALPIDTQPIATVMPEPDRLALEEGRSALREELDRLPDQLRMPVELCHLQGLTHHEAAERLGWPLGTVRSRLSRARDRLRDRLERRGVGVPSLVAGAVPPQTTIPSPPDWTRNLIQVAASTTDPRAPEVSVVGGSVAALASGALRTMFWTKIAVATAWTVAVGGITGVAWTGAIGSDDANEPAVLIAQAQPPVPQPPTGSGQPPIEPPPVQPLVQPEPPPQAPPSVPPQPDAPEPPESAPSAPNIPPAPSGVVPGAPSNPSNATTGGPSGFDPIAVVPLNRQEIELESLWKTQKRFKMLASRGATPNSTLLESQFDFDLALADIRDRLQQQRVRRDQARIALYYQEHAVEIAQLERRRAEVILEGYLVQRADGLQSVRGGMIEEARVNVRIASSVIDQQRVLLDSARIRYEELDRQIDAMEALLKRWEDKIEPEEEASDG